MEDQIINFPPMYYSSCEIMMGQQCAVSYYYTNYPQNAFNTNVLHQSYILYWHIGQQLPMWTSIYSRTLNNVNAALVACDYYAQMLVLRRNTYI